MKFPNLANAPTQELQLISATVDFPAMFTYLSEECDETTRMGAVGIGAVTGFILGIRGGMIRRLFYSGVGAYGMSAACYPKQTVGYTQVGIAESRKYATIAYNFAFGGEFLCC